MVSSHPNPCPSHVAHLSYPQPRPSPLLLHPLNTISNINPNPQLSRNTNHFPKPVPLLRIHLALKFLPLHPRHPHKLVCHMRVTKIIHPPRQARRVNRQGWMLDEEEPVHQHETHKDEE